MKVKNAEADKKAAPTEDDLSEDEKAKIFKADVETLANTATRKEILRMSRNTLRPSRMTPLVRSRRKSSQLLRPLLRLTRLKKLMIKTRRQPRLRLRLLLMKMLSKLRLTSQK